MFKQTPLKLQGKKSINFATPTRRIQRHLLFKKRYKRIRKSGMPSSTQGTSPNSCMPSSTQGTSYKIILQISLIAFT